MTPLKILGGFNIKVLLVRWIGQRRFVEFGNLAAKARLEANFYFTA